MPAGVVEPEIEQLLRRFGAIHADYDFRVLRAEAAWGPRTTTTGAVPPRRDSRAHRTVQG